MRSGVQVASCQAARPKKPRHACPGGQAPVMTDVWGRNMTTRQPSVATVRFARPGEGAWISSLFSDSIGIAYSDFADALDRGQLTNTTRVLDCALVVEERSSGRPLGALLAGAPVNLLKITPPELRLPMVELVVKLSAIAVLSDYQCLGLGEKLLRHAIAEYRARDYKYLYGQFTADPRLERFYERIGFSVLPAGQPLVPPFAVGRLSLMSSGPSDHWFQMTL